MCVMVRCVYNSVTDPRVEHLEKEKDRLRKKSKGQRKKEPSSYTHLSMLKVNTTLNSPFMLEYDTSKRLHLDNKNLISRKCQSSLRGVFKQESRGGRKRGFKSYRKVKIFSLDL